MGNWNLTPIGTLTFNDPETWWPMTATLYLDGTLDVVAVRPARRQPGSPGDGCADGALPASGGARQRARARAATAVERLAREPPAPRKTGSPQGLTFPSSSSRI